VDIVASPLRMHFLMEGYTTLAREPYTAESTQL
jgi:hypothetical protein